MAKVITVCVLLLLCEINQARKLPSFIKPCNSEDPQLSNCIINAMNSLRPRLPQGIPEMHLPKMEPLHMEKASLESGNDLKVTFESIDLYGLTTFKVLDGEFDIKNNFVKIDLRFDEIFGEADYSIQGKLLFLNLNGAGRVNGTINVDKATATLKGKRQTIKGKEYIIFDKIDIEVNLLPNGATAYFDNLFANSLELTRATNKAINDNISDILTEMRPVIRKTIGQIVLSFIGALFQRYSIEELFPEN